MKRVVITGIGALTPSGNDKKSTWDNLVEKVPGTGLISKFDTSGMQSQIAGELKEFDPGDFIPEKDILRLDPFVHYAASAAFMAAEDAGLRSRKPENINNSDLLSAAGVIIGSSRGGITSMEKALEKHFLKGSPFSAYLMSASTINMASSYVSIRLGIHGPSLGISTACASGTNAIGEAVRLVRSGEVDIVLAGGSEAPICRMAVGGYGSSGALSRRNNQPEKASRPFDKDRDGFVIAEGACILVIEELDHALKRGARIYAELAGYGSSSDAFHQTKPDSDGEAAAILNALNDANIEVDEVDYINAHATSTPLGDAAEAGAIRKVFGKQASDIYISSCKGTLGHMLGAAGAVETAITAISLSKGIITPTINLEAPDSEYSLNYVTAAIKKEIKTAITNSFGFGGVNVVLVLRKY